MTLKTKIIIVVVYSVVLVAGGYYLAPQKIKTEIKTVEVEKKKDTSTVDNTDQTHKKIIIVTDKKTNGEIHKTTTITDDSTTNTITNTVDITKDSKTSDQTKEITKSSGHLDLSFLAGVNLSAPPGTNSLVYGAHVNKSLLGPLTIGLWGLNNRTLGCSAGVSF